MTGLKKLVIPAVVAAFAATPALASTKDQSKPKKTEDGWQLTLSPKPYTADPNADYEKNYCPPGEKKGDRPKQVKKTN